VRLCTTFLPDLPDAPCLRLLVALSLGAVQLVDPLVKRAECIALIDGQR
jgi:hypothetical protein